MGSPSARGDERPDHVVILNEMVHNARIIPLDGRPHLPADLRRWVGDSRASWHGETLVIETRNFLRETSLGGSSASMRLVERYAPGCRHAALRVHGERPDHLDRPLDGTCTHDPHRGTALRVRLPRRQLFDARLAVRRRCDGGEGSRRERQ